MKLPRNLKYKDHDYFKYYNANSHNHFVGDCAIRAVCTAIGESWEDSARGLFEVGLKYGYPQNDPKTIDRYLKSKGFIKMKEPRDFYNKKLKALDFLKTYTGKSPIVAYLGSHHVAAIVNGKVNDIWDSSNQTIHSYYVKTC